MEWYQYLASFFAGAFLANVVPHFVHGISGNKFPTPFAKPPGICLSSSTTNVVWALVNLVIGFLLFERGGVNSENVTSLTVFLAGISAISIMASINFRKKHKE
ncbi:MAG: hypothetical protein M3O71_05535 [Bacteroidota bacterium]|nr:hypothetical protein [Bacteroidota bacterium]